LTSTPHKAPSRIEEGLNKRFYGEIEEGGDVNRGVVSGKDDETTNNKIRPKTYVEILKSGRKY